MTIAIDLTYNPYGGSLSQIENILKYIDDYKQDKYIVYCTKNNYLKFKRFESEKLIFKIISYYVFIVFRLRSKFY